MKNGEIPVDYRELPDHLLRNGRAVQHDGESESALAIVEWLQSEGVDAWASPKTRQYPALVRVNQGLGGRPMVGPNDWVFLEPDGQVAVYNNMDFNALFVTQSDNTYIYKMYETMFKNDALVLKGDN